ncbi:MAG TPA: DUF1569 domain-containing protein [Bacteroidia bacterium]|jgi:hypothetical protein|nr:DUF1569 domain-containing protein [Bacteroidia bacterium]
MYNLFETKNADDILSRLEKITSSHKAQWGKMKVEQMLAHCATALETPFGPDRKQHFMGKLFGKMAKKGSLSETPFKQDLPTTFIVNDARNFEAEKTKLADNIKKFVNGGPAAVTCKKHPFFGDFSTDDWSFLMHKHLDHHFKQFGA